MRKALPDELILTGSPDAVQKLMARAVAEGVRLGEQRSMQITHGPRTLKFSLVRLAAHAPDLMQRLAQWARAERVAVRAETNAVTGHPNRREAGARGWALNPWDWDENPWDWNEDPWDWDDNPWDCNENPASVPMVVPAGTNPAEGEALFLQQGAFQKLGLTDATGQRNPALADHQGEGVLVGLFDALPSQPVSLPWLTLHTGNLPADGTFDDRDLSDHGLICASLVHAVAPRAQVHLMEVCGKDGHGELYPLLEGISAFIDLAAGRPAVLNLSLGSQSYEDSSSLRALLQKATDLGMVVCAAAGNLAHGTPKVSALFSAQVPAAFPNVIAVSASNLSDQRASYSQRGDIAAPGGEDLNQPGPDDPEDIIGLGVSVGTSGYVRMDAGTSFAAPLMSGAAALLLENMPARDANTYAQVLAALKAGAVHGDPAAAETLAGSGLGAGILNLPGIFR